MFTAPIDLSEKLWQVRALDPDAEAIGFRGQWYSWGELQTQAQNRVNLLCRARRRLASDPVPARIERVDGLPRTPSLEVMQSDVIALFDQVPARDNPVERSKRSSERESKEST